MQTYLLYIYRILIWPSQSTTHLSWDMRKNTCIVSHSVCDLWIKQLCEGGHTTPNSHWQCSLTWPAKKLALVSFMQLPLQTHTTSRPGQNQNTGYDQSTSSFPSCIVPGCDLSPKCGSVVPNSKTSSEKCNSGPIGLFLVGGVPLVEDRYQASCAFLWECWTSVCVQTGCSTHDARLFARSLLVKHLNIY